MKKRLRWFILPSLFLFCTTSMAAMKCDILKKKSKKAHNLYVMNRHKAKNLNKQASILKQDRKRMPATVPLARRVIKNEIDKLAQSKRKRLSISLKYLERHLQLKKAAQKSCAQYKQKKLIHSKDLKKVTNLAQN